MNFNQLLIKIKEEAPSIIYDLDDHIDPEPLTLTMEDIELLVDFAVKNQPKIRVQSENKTLDMLTLLLSMGTVVTKDPMHPDRFLGQKDARIEQYIIEKAKVHARNSAGMRMPIVYGLSGNPPTINHLLFIQHLMTRYSPVHLIINAQSPLKSRKDYAPAELRLEMLTEMLVAEGVDLDICRVERLEIDRDPPSRMIGTLSLLVLRSNTKYILALGMDGLNDFTKWYQWQDFAALCELRFYPRDGLSLRIEEIQMAVKNLTEQGISVTLVYRNEEEKLAYERVADALGSAQFSLAYEPIQTYEGSATEIRGFYSQSPDEAHPSVHPVVDQMIRDQALYGYNNTVDLGHRESSGLKK